MYMYMYNVQCTMYNVQCTMYMYSGKSSSIIWMYLMYRVYFNLHRLMILFIRKLAQFYFLQAWGWFLFSVMIDTQRARRNLGEIVKIQKINCCLPISQVNQWTQQGVANDFIPTSVQKLLFTHKIDLEANMSCHVLLSFSSFFCQPSRREIEDCIHIHHVWHLPWTCTLNTYRWSGYLSYLSKFDTLI